MGPLRYLVTGEGFMDRTVPRDRMSPVHLLQVDVGPDQGPEFPLVDPEEGRDRVTGAGIDLLGYCPHRFRRPGETQRGSRGV